MFCRFVSFLCCVAFLCGIASARAGVVISEFLAENDGGLRDQDGDTPDWIELYNNSAASVNLAGWHLTDSQTNLTKWTFPSIDLGPGTFLIVFASGKDRAVAGAELHTNFKLDNDGEYLALVMADGTTVASSYSAFPHQRANVSFGIGSSNTVATLLPSNSNAHWLVPSNDSL